MLIAIILTFIIGYSAIVFEHNIKIDKAAVALMTGVLCWILYAFSGTPMDTVEHHLIEKFAESAQILFFLLGAMTIVELIDAHEGFDIIVSRLKTRKKVSLLWIIGILSYLLSSVLDNLTTTIVMISFIRKLVNDREDKLLLASIIVIAANAGGAWSPIGDVTTTMLWIGKQVTTSKLMEYVFVPSIICLLVPLTIISFKMSGDLEPINVEDDTKIRIESLSERHKTAVFFLGIGALMFVPIFKTVTHLPPFMGMLLSLGVMWAITELMHSNKNHDDKTALSVKSALERIDTASIMFFVGILLAVGALESTGILRGCAEWLTQTIGNQSVIAVVIGLISAIVDNVPLVAASMGMYSLEQFPQDDKFWHLIAYCAGTGGSILIIGSAAGVAAMGMERIEFFWYVKRISLLAALGYFAGAAAFILEHYIF